MVDPTKMCRKHLLGEHVELHMLVGTLKRGKSIDGFLENRLVEPQNIIKRHKQLVKEMKRRGYNHQSPISGFRTGIIGKVSKNKSLRELHKRCELCRIRIKEKNQDT